jgi:catechol 2,3-dioxygenase-like lactoylglutathione lyase family enzyme
MVEMHLEVDIIPVADVDRSKQFYQRLGWRFDADVAPADDTRIVQFTPPGSACSITFGQGITASAPGSSEGTLAVSDIEQLTMSSCAGASRPAGSGTVRHSRGRHGWKAPIPAAGATGRSALSAIPTAIPG